MAESNITQYEYSVESGMPIECYRFTHEGMIFQFTSNATDVDIIYQDENLLRTETYLKVYVERSEIKPNSRGSEATCTIQLELDNPIVNLFKGEPPVKPVTLQIIRLHHQDKKKFDIIFTGNLNLGNFDDAENYCTLSATMESYLKKELPNGTIQNYCINMLFDRNCRLLEEDFQEEIVIDRVDGLKIYSEELRNFDEDYFFNGIMLYDNRRQIIREHKENYIILKYSLIGIPNEKMILIPGCNHTFKTCNVKFDNHINFTGAIYIPSRDTVKNPAGVGMYWEDQLVVWRDSNGEVGEISM